MVDYQGERSDEKEYFPTQSQVCCSDTWLWSETLFSIRDDRAHAVTQCPVSASEDGCVNERVLLYELLTLVLFYQLLS